MLMSAGPGRIAVIDTSRASSSATSPSQRRRAPLRADRRGSRCAATSSSSARRGVISKDGGIEFVDLASQQAEGFFISEEDLGGDVTDSFLLSDHLGYAVVSGSDFELARRLLVQPRARVTKTLLSGRVHPRHRGEHARGELFVADHAAGASGLRVFRRSAERRQPLSERLDTGLPPFDIVFLK